MSFCCEGTATDGRHSPDCLAMKVRWPPTPPTGGEAARREVVTLAAPPTNSSPDWLPTADNINALPEPLRKYIADIETNADPAGMVAENVMLKDENAMLRAKIAEAVPPTDRLGEAERLLREALPHMNTGFNFPADQASIAIRAFLTGASITSETAGADEIVAPRSSVLLQNPIGEIPLRLDAEARVVAMCPSCSKEHKLDPKVLPYGTLLPYATSAVDVDGVIDEKNGVIYIGKATRQPDGTWRALANVGGALSVVECRITPETKT